MESDENTPSIAEAREALERAEAAEYGLSPAELASARRTGMDPRRYAALRHAPRTFGNGLTVDVTRAAIAAADEEPTDQEAA